MIVNVTNIIHRYCKAGGDKKWLGWFVHYEDDKGTELLYFGPAKGEQPPFEKGDLVKISFEKVNG